MDCKGLFSLQSRAVVAPSSLTGAASTKLGAHHARQVHKDASTCVLQTSTVSYCACTCWQQMQAAARAARAPQLPALHKTRARHACRAGSRPASGTGSSHQQCLHAASSQKLFARHQSSEIHGLWALWQHTEPRRRELPSPGGAHTALGTHSLYHLWASWCSLQCSESAAAQRLSCKTGSSILPGSSTTGARSRTNPPVSGDHTAASALQAHDAQISQV